MKWSLPLRKKIVLAFFSFFPREDDDDETASIDEDTVFFVLVAIVLASVVVITPVVLLCDFELEVVGKEVVDRDEIKLFTVVDDGELVVGSTMLPSS